MSHTTSIDDILFTDISALQAAIAELQAAGVDCSLAKGEKPRAFYAEQQGMGVADYVIKLPSARYDIGLYYNAEKKGYEARTDFFAGSVEAAVGTSPVGVANPVRAKMGRLYQTYAVHAATRKAVQQGYSVTRREGKDGLIQLVVNVPN